MILVNSTKRLIAVFLLLFCVAFAQQKRPNIIVILSDDVGFEEFGVYDVKKGVSSLTPNIDKLGASGTVFKNAWGTAGTELVGSFCPKRAFIELDCTCPLYVQGSMRNSFS